MSSSIQPPPLPGDIVAQYKLIETLGIGGNATVYRAQRHDDDSAPEIALKILHPGKTTLEDTKRFRREFLSLQAIDHPNIVRVYDSGVQDDYPWLAMELVQGPDLNQLIKQWEKDSPNDLFTKLENILRDICRALNYVHQRGMIHRDLKPSNVLITENGVAKLTDFGVVKAPEAFRSELTTMGRLVGTVAFMAPEHIMGDKCDLRADLYSLGALLYMGLTGKKPFEATSIAGYLSMHLTHDAPNPQSINPKIPDQLNNICIKLLQKEPENRYSSAAEILQILSDIPNFPTLVGRDSCIESFRSFILNYQNGESIHLSITGKSLSGKTTLLHRLKQELLAQGLSYSEIKEEYTPPEPPPDACILCVDDIEKHHDLYDHITELGSQGTQIFLISTSKISKSPPPFFTQYHHYPLPPLSLEDTQSLFRQKNLIGSALVILSQRIHEQLQGNIGYMLQSLNRIIDSGWLKKTPKGKLKANIPMEELKKKSIPIPQSLKNDFQRELGLLSVEAKHILECLVVFGGPCSFHELSLCTNKSNEHIQKITLELSPKWVSIQKDVIVGKKESFIPLYTLLSSDRKLAWHQRISSVLVKYNRRDVTNSAGEIAYHLIKSNQQTTAFPFLISAAQKNVQNNNIIDAKELLLQAQKILPVINEKLPLNKAKLSLFSLCGYIHKRENLLTKASTFFEQAAQQAYSLGQTQAAYRASIEREVCLLQLGQPPQNIHTLFSHIDTSEPIWKEGVRTLAQYYFDRSLIHKSRELLNEINRSKEPQDQAFCVFYKSLLLLQESPSFDLVLRIVQYEKQFDFHWDLYIVQSMIVLGLWSQAISLLEHILTCIKDALNPAHQSYARALKSYVLYLLGDREAAIETYRDARMTRISADTSNGIRSFVQLQRLSFLLNMRIPSDKNTFHPSFETIDQPSMQLKYIYARAQKTPIEQPTLYNPWSYCLMVIDYLLSIQEHAVLREKIQHFWDQANQLQIPFLSLSISKIAHNILSEDIWEQRLQKQLIDHMAQQPQYFQLQEHWRNKDRLL